jgi:hypothetical protein
MNWAKILARVNEEQIFEVRRFLSQAGTAAASPGLSPLFVSEVGESDSEELIRAGK